MFKRKELSKSDPDSIVTIEVPRKRVFFEIHAGLDHDPVFKKAQIDTPHGTSGRDTLQNVIDMFKDRGIDPKDVVFCGSNVYRSRLTFIGFRYETDKERAARVKDILEKW